MGDDGSHFSTSDQAQENEARDYNEQAVQSPLKGQARANKEERRRADTSIGKQLFD
jgi:hypothetical protein